MFLFNGISINQEGSILEIQYEDKEFLKGKLFVDFQRVNTQYGEYFMFAVKNEGYAERQQLFIKAIESLYKQIADYLSDHVGYDMSPIVILTTKVHLFINLSFILIARSGLGMSLRIY